MCIGTHPFIPAENTVKVEMVYNTPGGIAENTLYFADATSWDASDVGVIAGEIKAWWEDTIRNWQSTGVSLAKVRAQDISVEDGNFWEYTAGLPEAGLGATAVLPQNVTGAIKFSTGRAGRSYRGRNFFVGLGEAYVTGDTIDSTLIAGVMTGYEGLDDPAVISKGHQVVVSYCQNGEWLTDAVVTAVNGRSFDNTVDSQRRRLTHRGS